MIFAPQKFGFKTKFSTKKAKSRIRGNTMRDKATWKSWGPDGILAVPEKKKIYVPLRGLNQDYLASDISDWYPDVQAHMRLYGT